MSHYRVQLLHPWFELVSASLGQSPDDNMQVSHTVFKVDPLIRKKKQKHKTWVEPSIKKQ